jgi:tellurite resistance protein TerC
LRERRKRHLEHGVIYRGSFVVAGVIVLLAGVAMLVLPGPALVVIPIGLAMLALEFAWAENLLEKALERAEAAKEVASKTSPRERILGGLAIALALVLLYDIPYLPV